MKLLTIENLHKTYGTGEKALNGVSIEVASTDVVALLGLSGSGKSTLLRCINRLVEPDSGSVVFDGVDITTLSQRQLRLVRRNIGMIFQGFNLVDRLSVIENVLCGRLGYTNVWRAASRKFNAVDIQRAIGICSRVGLVDHVRKRADELSGGQRQRVGIARALMQEPKLLLLDEPTSSLDPKIGAEVMDLVVELASERHTPMIISIHDLGFARRYSTRTIGLQGGIKVFDEATSAIDNSALAGVYRMSVVN